MHTASAHTVLNWLCLAGWSLGCRSELCSATMLGLRCVLRIIGLVDYLGHPQPPDRSQHGCTVGVNRDPPVWPSTQAGWWRYQSASPYVRWTTTYYDCEEKRNMDLSPYTS